jgi:hypothetical protein
MRLVIPRPLVPTLVISFAHQEVPERLKEARLCVSGSPMPERRRALRTHATPRYHTQTQNLFAPPRPSHRDFPHLQTPRPNDDIATLEKEKGHYRRCSMLRRRAAEFSERQQAARRQNGKRDCQEK